MGMAHAGSTPKLPVHGDPAVGYTVAIELSGIVRIQIASFTTNSIIWLACCSILVSSQWMGWSSIQACLAMADFFVKPLMHASLCSFRCVRSWHVDYVCLILHKEGVLDLSEERTEGGSGLEHCSDVEVHTHPPNPLTNASYVREVDSGWPLLLPFLMT